MHALGKLARSARTRTRMVLLMSTGLGNGETAEERGVCKDTREPFREAASEVAGAGRTIKK